MKKLSLRTFLRFSIFMFVLFLIQYILLPIFLKETVNYVWAKIAINLFLSSLGGFLFAYFEAKGKK